MIARIKFLLARQFGRYMEYKDGEYTYWRGYHWRGVTYMVEWNGPRR